MNRRNFFAELKRRNVIRMAGLYLVGAWLLTYNLGLWSWSPGQGFNYPPEQWRHRLEATSP
jgi:hypothetical protein